MKTVISTFTAVLFIVSAAYATDANNRNGISGINMSINTERIHRSGEEVQFNLMVTNKTSNNENGVNISFADSEVIIDGENRCPIDGNVRFGSINFPAVETIGINTWISQIPLNAETITSIKIVGRAPNSGKSTDRNPYGDFDYRFTNIALPPFPVSNVAGCVFYDTEVSLHIVSISASGNNLVVDFTLTNNGRKDFSIDASDFGRGTAHTSDGEQYDVTTKFPNSLPIGEAIKGQLVISNGANEDFASIRQQFYLSDGKNSWQPGLMLRNISKPVNQ